MFTGHIGVELETKNSKIKEKSADPSMLNNTLLNNPWMKQEILRKGKHTLN